jgi:DNA-directed RNA polymerase subunit RPC12/RpoP
MFPALNSWLTVKVTTENTERRIFFRMFCGEFKEKRIMQSKCPGQDFRNLTVSVHKCPKCGRDVEVFSDEMKAKCPKCKTVVEKENVPTCIEWCKEAKKCLGPERWQKVMEAIGKNDK